MPTPPHEHELDTNPGAPQLTISHRARGNHEMASIYDTSVRVMEKGHLPIPTETSPGSPP